MKSFFEQINKNELYTQIFMAWRHPEQDEKDGIVYYSDSQDLIKRMNNEPRSSRFVFHGFFDRSLWPRLVMSTLSKRCSWVCWGHDIYQHKTKKRGLKLRVMHYLHGLLARRFINNYALNNGDGELIKTLLKTNNVKVLPYPLIGSNALRNGNDTEHPIVILLGNSASPNNEHMQALDWLSQYAEEDIRIVVPLNYAGPKDYIEKVIDKGRALFGAKFEPITKMLDKTQYDDLLINTDVVFFAHQRQQGLYVVYSALKQGQKLYMRSDISSFSFLQEAGFFVSDAENISGMNFSNFIHMDDAQAAKNRQLMLAIFSEEALLPQWCEALKKLFKN
jgi:hypothetical protein